MGNKQQLDATIKTVAPRISVHTFSEDEDNCRASIVIKMDNDGPGEPTSIIYGLGDMPVSSIGDWEFVRERLCEIFTEEEQDRYLKPLKVEAPPKPAKGKKAKKTKAVEPDTHEVVPDEEDLPDADFGVFPGLDELEDGDMKDDTNSM